MQRTAYSGTAYRNSHRTYHCVYPSYTPGSSINIEMRPLEYILDIDQFTALMGEGKKAPHSSGWYDCLLKVKEQILQDHTTTKDNLREKVRNYALNYLAVTPEANGIDKDKLIGELADKIEDDLKDYSFFQQPQAALIAQRERGKIPEDPEERFIKLSP